MPSENALTPTLSRRERELWRPLKKIAKSQKIWLEACTDFFLRSAVTTDVATS
jgi:hypothetical protein